MSQELVQQVNTLDLPDFGSADFATPESFEAMVRPGYLARVQLCGGNSGLVQEGKVGVGRYACVRSKEDFIDLGQSMDCVPLIHRFAAMRYTLGSDTKVEIHYDPNSPEFKQVQTDSELPDSGCQYGPQFLLWVPVVKEFCTFLFGSKSARPESRKLYSLLNEKRAATFKAKLIDTGKYKWHAPVIVPCSAQLELPDISKAMEVVERFKKPGKQEEVDDSVQSNQTATSSNGRAR